MDTHLDDTARAELLCYLVVGQLIAMARTGEWLRTDHLIESARSWLASNGAACEWPERLELAEASRVLAPNVLALPPFRDSRLLANCSRTDGDWITAYRSCAAFMTSA